MSRKTFESISSPLPKRRNIVITRAPAWRADGVDVIHHPDQLAALPDTGPRVFIIGSAEIYQAFLPVLDELIISHVLENHPGDTWFPEFHDRFPNSEILESFPDFVIRRWW